MGGRDAAGTAGLALVALLALVQSARLDVGSITRPGPGFFPLVLGVALLVVAAALLASAWRTAPARRPEAGGAVTESPAASRGGGALIATLLAFAVYVAVFERLGFLLATGGFLAFLFGPVARYRWPVALGGALAVTLAAHLVFDVWLQVRLPRGVLAR
jgi:hypothetical protein